MSYLTYQRKFVISSTDQSNCEFNSNKKKLKVIWFWFSNSIHIHASPIYKISRVSRVTLYLFTQSTQQIQQFLLHFKWTTKKIVLHTIIVPIQRNKNKTYPILVARYCITKNHRHSRWSLNRWANSSESEKKT